MSTQRVSMFISHKVASHRRAAERVKTLLESRAERLDVHICEDIPANTLWRQWIADRIAQSQLCLVVLPPATLDLTWIINEIGRFHGAWSVPRRPSPSRIPSARIRPSRSPQT